MCYNFCCENNQPQRAQRFSYGVPTVNRAKILVVEDESIVALDIQHRLQSLGFTTTPAAATGEEAISKAEELRPDLVLMDIKLRGEMSGIQAAEIIRARFDVPVIFVTAYADESTLQRAKVSEPFGYILKPFEERELAISIEMALYKHQTEKRLRESEVRLRTIFTSVLDGMFLLDPQQRCVEVNPVGCQLLGYSPEELLGRDICSLFADDRERVWDDLQRFWQDHGGETGGAHPARGWVMDLG